VAQRSGAAAGAASLDDRDRHRSDSDLREQERERLGLVFDIGARRSRRDLACAAAVVTAKRL
jgi:hypothetical protein